MILLLYSKRRSRERAARFRHEIMRARNAREFETVMFDAQYLLSTTNWSAPDDGQCTSNRREACCDHIYVSLSEKAGPVIQSAYAETRVIWTGILLARSILVCPDLSSTKADKSVRQYCLTAEELKARRTSLILW